MKARIVGITVGAAMALAAGPASAAIEVTWTDGTLASTYEASIAGVQTVGSGFSQNFIGTGNFTTSPNSVSAIGFNPTRQAVAGSEGLLDVASFTNPYGFSGITGTVTFNSTGLVNVPSGGTGSGSISSSFVGAFEVVDRAASFTFSFAAFLPGWYATLTGPTGISGPLSDGDTGAGLLAPGLYTLSIVSGPYGFSYTGPGFFSASGSDVLSFTVSPVPEPTTWAMMVLGFGAAGVWAWRRKRKAAAVPA